MTDSPDRSETVSNTNGPDRDHSGVVVDGTIGGVVGILVSFLPFSTVLGGVTAGYLHGGSRREGALTGAVAGVVMLLPLVGGALALTLLSVPLPGPHLTPAAVAVLTVTFSAFYVLGPGTVGGVLGATARQRGWFE